MITKVWNEEELETAYKELSDYFFFGAGGRVMLEAQHNHARFLLRLQLESVSTDDVIAGRWTPEEARRLHKLWTHRKWNSEYAALEYEIISARERRRESDPEFKSTRLIYLMSLANEQELDLDLTLSEAANIAGVDRGLALRVGFESLDRETYVH